MSMRLETGLASRMKILDNPLSQDTMKPQTCQWYHGYAEAVLSALQHSQFQCFLSWLLRYEHIPSQHIKAIHVRTFPRIMANGRYLNGAATSKGIIAIYPYAKLNTVQNTKRSEEYSLKYVQWRARATLIHEILHFKYRHREMRIRQLTRKYTHRCMRPTTRMMKRVFNSIFRIPTRHKLAS